MRRLARRPTLRTSVWPIPRPLHLVCTERFERDWRQLLRTLGVAHRAEVGVRRRLADFGEQLGRAGGLVRVEVVVREGESSQAMYFIIRGLLVQRCARCYV